jgi:hypothetical protein
MSNAADRQRRLRRRRQAGRLWVAIEIDQELVDGFVDLGRLPPSDETNRPAIAAAVVALCRECVTRNADDAELSDSVRDDEPVGRLVRSFVAVIPPDAKGPGAARGWSNLTRRGRRASSFCTSGRDCDRQQIADNAASALPLPLWRYQVWT